MIRVYQCKTGLYKGMYHVRDYVAGKYRHIKRVRTPEEVQDILKNGYQPKEKMMTIPIKPAGKYILTTAPDIEETTDSGIVLTKDINSVAVTARVLAIGPGVLGVTTGHKAIFWPNQAETVTFGSTTYLMVHEDAVDGVIEA